MRGLVVLGSCHTVADLCKMLSTELQLAPLVDWWQLDVVAADDVTTLTTLSTQPPAALLLPLLPSTPCHLLVGNCAQPSAAASTNPRLPVGP